MIILFLRDGLGNQLFQYAFFRSLENNLGVKGKISLIRFKNDPSERNCALQHFNINTKICENKLQEFFRKATYKLKYLKYSKNPQNNKSINGLPIIYSDDFIYVLDAFQYIEFNLSPRKLILLEGCFQNTAYFSSIKNILKKELTVKDPILSINQPLMQHICESNSVCVHIRRGDYLSDSWAKLLLVCNKDYYISAMERISQRISNPTFFVFSNTHDDIVWIKENYDFSKYNVVYVDNSNPDYEEFRLMKSCKHFIISNSSFSWWAQYLSDNENRIVVAPSVWHKKDRGWENLYEEHWQLIDVSEGLN